MSAEELEVFFADEPEVLAEADCAELLLLADLAALKKQFENGGQNE
jgi:hypothetical protein